MNTESKILKKQQITCQQNKKRVENKIMVNLFGENDLNIYIFNKIGIFLMIVTLLYPIQYFYSQLQNMKKGYNDTFSSRLINLDYKAGQKDNLSKDGNVL